MVSLSYSFESANGEILAEKLIDDGMAAFKDGNFSLAIQLSDEVLKQQPNNYRALLLKGDTLYLQEKWYESALLYGVAFKTNPTDENLKNRLLNIHGRIPSEIIDAELKRTIIDANGNLVTKTITNKVYGLDIPQAEEFIKRLPIEKIIIRDGQKFEVHEHVQIIKIKNSMFFGRHDLDFFGHPFSIFRATDNQLQLIEGDTATLIFSFFIPVDSFR